MRTVRLIPLLVLAAAIVPAGTAHAGGWATVELDRLPVGVTAGEPWRMEMLVKQHGITPLDDLEPSVRIDNGAGVVRTFRARPAGRPGWYVAKVTYPSAGAWSTRLFDGFTDATPHQLAPLNVAPAGGAPATADLPDPAPAASAADTAIAATGSVDGGFPWPQAVAIAFVALLWTAGWIAAAGRPRMRRRRAAAAQRYLPAP